MTKSIVPQGQAFDDMVAGVLANKGGVLDRFHLMVKNASAEVPDLEKYTEHAFVPRFYIRTTTAKAGWAVITKVHQSEHSFFISEGHCLIFDEATGTRMEVKAPYAGITKPGTRRLVLVAEDIVWTTFHRTDSTDLEEIEKELIYPYEPSLPAAEIFPELS